MFSQKQYRIHNALRDGKKVPRKIKKKFLGKRLSKNKCRKLLNQFHSIPLGYTLGSYGNDKKELSYVKHNDIYVNVFSDSVVLAKVLINKWDIKLAILNVKSDDDGIKHICKTIINNKKLISYISKEETVDRQPIPFYFCPYCGCQQTYDVHSGWVEPPEVYYTSYCLRCNAEVGGADNSLWYHILESGPVFL